jgi:BASS family bile acid:Na+ symporter
MRLEAIGAAIGNGTLVVLVAFTLLGLAVGHWLGGPDPDERTVLALAAGARHPGIAMAIAGLNFPEQRVEVLAVVLLHVIISGIVATPYVLWRKRSHAGVVAGGQGLNGA